MWGPHDVGHMMWPNLPVNDPHATVDLVYSHEKVSLSKYNRKCVNIENTIENVIENASYHNGLE